jgi:integrase
MPETMRENRRGTRRTIAPNIYEDDLGIAAVARAAGHRPKEKRFPKGTPLKKIHAWQEATQVEMRKTAKRAKGQRGTLAGDIVARLAQLPDGRAKDNTRWDLNAWLERFGAKKRDQIDVAALRRQVGDWKEAGVPASTINHRRRVLAQLWDALDGEDAPNPARRVKRVKEVLGDPAAWPMDALDAIITAMASDRGEIWKGEQSFKIRPFRRFNKSRARLYFLLWSGMPPGSMQMCSPHRVARDVEMGKLYYPAREKGAGAPAVLLPLYPRAVPAVRDWLRAGAWGTCSEPSLRAALQRAAKAYARAEAEAGRTSPVPATVTTYDLRHSFLTWLYETSGDPFLVQLYGQHLDLKTTHRYTRKGVPKRALDAIAAIAKFENPT